MKRLLIIFLIIIFNCSCNNDSINEELQEMVLEDDNTFEEEEEEEEEITQSINPNPIGNIAGTIETFNKDLIDDNYILINDAGNNFVYLMNKNAEVLHQWNLNGGNLGNDCELLPNGQLLTMTESEDPKIQLGGTGGKIQLLDKFGNIDWSYVYSTENEVLHHDAEMLPNGNIIILTWERRTAEEANSFGYKMDIELFPDGIIEVNPNSNEIEWQWHMWDHTIQDFDNTKGNYGIVSQNPQLIDINYTQLESGDITHANGIAYDPIKDLIYVSVNFYSEVWVIDHSTTVLESSSHSGGNYNIGGDLVYRFGNPSAYKNNVGDRLFNNNHYPNLLADGNFENILIFSNGSDLNQSIVYELKLPTNLILEPNIDNEPEIIWQFTDPDLYAPRVSGAVKLPNDNILITEGDFGLWEVTKDKEVVWKFTGDGFYWRGYSFSKNDPTILDLLQ
ncbi:aryl-sulfate sulfotransferase [uncultured Maribacter sp.]|uniref:aryl-sulfate sulfotransferase n=1 Tax=uncultured Maribacter sp. TaxID=431308 RepID=UPI002615FB73|nr:aryl-sulfate sulfotransferase [uncultured Maribacter sp.]